jgi:hypothetical protein
MTEFQTKLINRLPPMTKEIFKDMLDSGELLQIFEGDPRQPGVLGRVYFASFEDGEYIISYTDWDYNEEEADSVEDVAFTNYNDFWAHLLNMMEDEDFSPEYNFLADTLTEHVNEEHPAIESDQELEGTDNAVVACKVADVITHSEDEKPVDCEGKKKPLEKPLTESKHDPFHEAIFEAIDYLVEFSDIFPVPENIGAASWEELKEDIRYGLSSDFEIAEIIMEYFNKDLAISKKHPEMFEDDPQSELTLEMYIRLKRAYDRAVVAYKATHSEDFTESLQEGRASRKSTTAVPLNEELMTASTIATGIAAIVMSAPVSFLASAIGGGWIWDRTKDLWHWIRKSIYKIFVNNPNSQWTSYKSYLIEITPEYQINIWNPAGEQIFNGLKSVPAAKRIINALPAPEIVEEISVAIEDARLEDIPTTKLDDPTVADSSNVPDASETEEIEAIEDPEPADFATKVPVEEEEPAVEPDISQPITKEGPKVIHMIEAIEDTAEIEPISDDPAEEPSKDYTMANTAGISGMDFETACQMFGVPIEGI